MAHNTAIVLMGVSGAGKSTMIKMMLGLVRPDSGVGDLHERTFG